MNNQSFLPFYILPREKPGHQNTQAVLSGPHLHKLIIVSKTFQGAKPHCHITLFKGLRIDLLLFHVSKLIKALEATFR